MIKNPSDVERARRNHEREHPLSLEQKYAVLDAMYEEVRRLGRLTSGRSPDRIKHKLAMARVLNAGI